MALLPEVLECCTMLWQEHDAIAREFDRRFPPRWYSISRHLKLLIEPDRPSVDLHFLLELAVQQGELEHKLQEISHSFLYRLKERKLVRDPRKNQFSLPTLCAA